MQEKITYSCTALDGTNKKGIIKPDADGYYELVLGALDIHNSAGQFYPLAPAKKHFEESSSFMRRIKEGNLKAECGHPRKAPGTSNRDFITRVLDIVEQNVCAHIKEVTLVRDKVKDRMGNYVVAIIGKVKPAGPHAEALKAALENPNENVCFSIRSLTDDVVSSSSWTKNIRTIVTFDWVTEPGIHVAKKWHAPALESYDFMMENFIDLANQPHAVGFEDDDTHVSPTSVLRDFDYFTRKGSSNRKSLEW